MASPTEIKPDKNRVAITPSGMAAYRTHGHEVVVQAGAALLPPVPPRTGGAHRGVATRVQRGTPEERSAFWPYALWRVEGGGGTRSKLIKFPLRPDPLARYASS